jgi:hypothetical protein
MTASIPRFADVLSKATRPERPVASRASDFCGQYDEAKGTGDGDGRKNVK